jgi:predicted RNase H-like HicB family nuclease
MASTLNVPIEITAVVHEIAGGGYWAEVTSLPGCIAQAETLEALRDNIRSAIDDWLAGSPVKTEGEAEGLASIQGGGGPVDGPFPVPYDYQPPPSWSDDDA